jgi:hypothetical protein
MPQKGRGQGVRRKDGQLRKSTTSGRNPVVDDSNWRKRLQRAHRLKFDDVAKQRFLEALFETGLKCVALDAAGVSRATMERHYEDDPEFQEAYDVAMEEYSARGVKKIEREALEGHQELTYDREGNLVKERRVFETRLRERFLEAHDPRYHPKQKIEHSGEVGGIAIVPGVAALSDWEAAVQQHDRASAKSQDPNEAAVQRGDAQE